MEIDVWVWSGDQVADMRTYRVGDKVTWTLVWDTQNDRERAQMFSDWPTSRIEVELREVSPNKEIDPFSLYTKDGLFVYAQQDRVDMPRFLHVGPLEADFGGKSPINSRTNFLTITSIREARGINLTLVEASSPSVGANAGATGFIATVEVFSLF